MKIRETNHGRFTSKEIIEASFEEWIDFVFSKDKSERDWISDNDIPNWSLPTSVTLNYIERTFREAASVLASYSVSQLANGLNFIHNGSHSDTVHLFRDETVPLQNRLAALHAIRFLYEGCFAKCCDDAFSNCDEGLNNPLNGVCYMWWDVFVIYGKSDSVEERASNEECLSVMEAALEINHTACQESALHGLGHWKMYYPERVPLIIDSFLKKHDNVRSDLRDYAESAQRGCVQ